MIAPHMRTPMYVRKYLKNMARASIVLIAKIFRINLLRLAYNEIGILNSGILDKTGEEYVIKKVLPKLVTAESPILFDVGANIGEYSQSLRTYFPKAQIFSFEPNPKAYEMLKKNTSHKNVKCFNIGIGSKVSQNILYSYEHATSLGTMKKEALETLYGRKEKIEEIKFSISTIDDFCANNNINHIDFLKIDVEGQEMEVLKGARQMIQNRTCPIIQFEFNDFHVFYRVFFKDFYDTLMEYDFYRLTKGTLIHLGKYDTIHEVFKFQNILAIQKNQHFNMFFNSLRV